MHNPLRSRVSRALALLFAFTLVAAACGDDWTDESSSTTMEMGEHGGHDEPIDVSDLDPTPAVTVEVTEDPKSGWNLSFELTGHELAPENASTAHVEGEGHAHLYIDGEKAGRLYTTDYFLGELDPGMREIGVELSANSHAPLAVDGEVVLETVMVDVPEAADGDAGHSHGADAEPVDASGFAETPSVTVEAIEDPKSGINLRATFEGHEPAPDSVSIDNVEGEGHAHIYVDGEKLTRLYGEWYHLADLEPGEHEITVEASANDHSPLAVDGEIVADTVTVEVEGEGGHGGDGHGDGEHGDGGTGEEIAEADADSVLEVTVADGTPTGATGRQEVAVGDTVLVRVMADVADEVHVHGYDLFGQVAPGEMAEIQFTADIPGVFEIELESGGLLLTELAVS